MANILQLDYLQELLRRKNAISLIITFMYIKRQTMQKSKERKPYTILLDIHKIGIRHQASNHYQKLDGYISPPF